MDTDICMRKYVEIQFKTSAGGRKGYMQVWHTQVLSNVCLKAFIRAHTIVIKGFEMI